MDCWWFLRDNNRKKNKKCDEGKFRVVSISATHYCSVFSPPFVTERHWKQLKKVKHLIVDIWYCPGERVVPAKIREVATTLTQGGPQSQSHMFAHTSAHSFILDSLPLFKNEKLLHMAKAEATPRDLKICVMIWRRKKTFLWRRIKPFEQDEQSGWMIQPQRWPKAAHSKVQEAVTRWKMCAAMRAVANPLGFHVILMHSLPCTSLQASSLGNFNFPTNASFEMMARDILNLRPHPSP